jgi:hypothetical protein
MDFAECRYRLHVLVLWLGLSCMATARITVRQTPGISLQPVRICPFHLYISVLIYRLN